MQAKSLAERYNALTPAQQKVASARYLDLAAHNHQRRSAAWAEAIETAEQLQRL
jgi:hypothetical protein